MLFWCILLGLPVAACGCLAAVSPERATRFFDWFKESRGAAWVLAAVAWFWTAYECDTIGIDVFDMVLKRFPGQLWLMAALLSYLTFIWMPANLSVRALTGILMLIPAELFKATRPVLPDGGFADVHILVATAYIGAVTGMYGMFYPWRLEKGMAFFQKKASRMRALGLGVILWGIALVGAGIGVALGIKRRSETATPVETEEDAE